jgi:hypothetical protein
MDQHDLMQQRSSPSKYSRASATSQNIIMEEDENSTGRLSINSKNRRQ